MDERYRALSARHSCNHDPILASMTLKILAAKFTITRRRGRHRGHDPQEEIVAQTKGQALLKMLCTGIGEEIPMQGGGHMERKKLPDSCLIPVSQ